MTVQRGFWYFVGLVLLVALPTISALAWYEVTQDPSIRPLGITVDAIRAFASGWGEAGIVAVVAWDPQTSPRVTRRDMETALRNAFSAKGVDVRVVFRRSTEGTWVTYEIGPSTIGPLPQSRAAEGINAAVEAYRMKVPWQPK